MGPSNEYEAALWNVGLILQDYDLDKMFPVYGFGGVPTHMNINSVIHCFPLNGNLGQPEVATV
jgi:hypothetical protein